MSGHRVTWIHDGDSIHGRVHCDEGEYAPCCTSCAHGCESWSHVAPDGRTHLADGDVVHEMTGHAYCNVVEFITNDGSVAEFYDGPDVPVHDGPITPSWDGDAYLWSYAEVTDS